MGRSGHHGRGFQHLQQFLQPIQRQFGVQFFLPEFGQLVQFFQFVTKFHQFVVFFEQVEQVIGILPVFEVFFEQCQQSIQRFEREQSVLEVHRKFGFQPVFGQFDQQFILEVLQEQRQ